MRHARPTVSTFALGLGLIALAGALLAGSPTTSAQVPDLRSSTDSFFYIAKSENRNQVHYGIHVDATCAPVGDAPIYAYWRTLESGPNARSRLLAREEPAYGIAMQRVATRNENGALITLGLRAFPSRPLLVEVRRTPEGCQVRARAQVSGQRATLERAFVQIGFLFHVQYVEITGQTSRGQRVSERISS